MKLVRHHQLVAQVSSSVGFVRSCVPGYLPSLTPFFVLGPALSIKNIELSHTTIVDCPAMTCCEYFFVDELNSHII